MISTGNDVVDLNKINQQRSAEYRFYSKFIDNAGQEYFNQIPEGRLSFINYVWLLWSVKESAYKYLKRLEPELIFSPIKIDVFKIDFELNVFYQNIWPESTALNPDNKYLTGEVKIQEQRLFFRSVITNQYITSAVSSNKNFEGFVWDVMPINDSDYPSQSLSARAFAISKLSGYIRGNLSIQKSASGYPVVYRGDVAISLPLSLAHHGNYAAYSFEHQQKPLPA